MAASWAPQVSAVVNNEMVDQEGTFCSSEQMPKKEVTPQKIQTLVHCGKGKKRGCSALLPKNKRRKSSLSRVELGSSHSEVEEGTRIDRSAKVLQGTEGHCSQGHDTKMKGRDGLIQWVLQKRKGHIAKSVSSDVWKNIDFEKTLRCWKQPYMKLPYTAHFIFLQIGLGTLADHPLYQRNIEEFRRFNPCAVVKIWGEREINELVQKEYPHLIERWNSFPSKWYYIDFARYLILHSHGGLYIDMDMQCTRELPARGVMDFIDKDDEYVHKSAKTIRFCNNIIGFRDEKLYGKLIEFSLKRLDNMRLPKSWKCRNMLYKVGARMYHSFCVKHNLERTAVRDYFYNHRTWSLYKIPFSQTERKSLVCELGRA